MPLILIGLTPKKAPTSAADMEEDDSPLLFENRFVRFWGAQKGKKKKRKG
jgi:hypothetical protein